MTGLSQLHLQKYIFRLFYVFAFVLFMGIFVYAFKTEMSRESVGEQAPFTQTLQAQNDTLPAQRAIPLDQPHRTARELSRWVSERVSEIMTFELSRYDAQLSSASQYFSPQGYEEYATYLKQADLKTTLQQRNLDAGVIVEEPPLMLNSGPAGGVYRWLYEVPVTVSYIPADVRQIKPDTNSSLSRRLTIRVQIGRHEGSDNGDQGEHVRIESWSVSPRR